MWRDILRNLLVGAGFIERPRFTIRFVDRHPSPDQISVGEIVVVEGDEYLKWACFRCPGGCGNRFQLSLYPSRHPQWRIRTDWLNRPSIMPSVLQVTECRAHFWVRQGNVEWCADSRCHVPTKV